MAILLEYHPKLYLGDSISEKKLDRIKKKLENKPLTTGVFLITMSRNSYDQLDIFSARLLVQRYYTKNPPYVVGIAGNYEEAVEMVEQLVQECLKARGDCALKEYLRC